MATILIVNENANLTGFLKFILETAGYQTKVLDNGLALFDEADADPPAARLALLLPGANPVQADRVHRAAHGLGIVAAVEQLVGDVGEGHLGCLHQVALADLLRLDAAGPRDLVVQLSLIHIPEPPRPY